MVVKVDIQKIRSGQYWTNRYLLDVADPGDVSSDMVVAIASAEQNLYATTVTIISARVSDMVPDTENYIIYPLSMVGGNNDGGEPLPGFITLRVDMGVSFGRPLRKYLRTYVGEGLTAGGQWQAAYVTQAQTNYTNLLIAVPTICDPQGNHATTVAAKSFFQMRQLRGGTKKRLTPVIPTS